MTYQEFKNTIVHTIQTKLGSNVNVAIQDIIKNNDTHLDGLTVFSDQSNISPTIYLNHYYKQFLQGKSLSDIYADLLHIYENCAPSDHIDLSFFTDYNKVKDRIIFKLINYERNNDLLSRVPHVRCLDLAIIFNCLISTDKAGFATILIHSRHLSFWNISTETLYELAMKNTPKLLSYHLHNMSDILKTLLSPEELADVSACKPAAVPMYILTNSRKLHGSVCIIYKNLLSEIADYLKSDLYILPSSVHEVILIPAVCAEPRTDFSSMIREVNESQVSREEILSDHVYYFSRTSRTLSM